MLQRGLTLLLAVLFCVGSRVVPAEARPWTRYDVEIPGGWFSTEVPPESNPFKFPGYNQVQFTASEPHFRTAFQAQYEFGGGYFNRIPLFSISFDVVRVSTDLSESGASPEALRDEIAEAVARQIPHWISLKLAAVAPAAVDGWVRLGSFGQQGAGSYARICTRGVVLLIFPAVDPRLRVKEKRRRAAEEQLAEIVRRTTCHSDSNP